MQRCCCWTMYLLRWSESLSQPLCTGRLVCMCVKMLLIFLVSSVHTSKWIVEKCFKGDLVKDRTILLVVSVGISTPPLPALLKVTVPLHYTAPYPHFSDYIQVLVDTQHLPNSPHCRERCILEGRTGGETRYRSGGIGNIGGRTG